MQLIRTLSRLLHLPPRLPRRRSAPARARRILLHEMPLAGFDHHRGPGVWPFLSLGAELSLRREPLNRHDTNAIAVWFRNEHLGYVPRRDNPMLARLMDRGERLEARVIRLLESDNPWRRVRIRVELVSSDD